VFFIPKKHIPNYNSVEIPNMGDTFIYAGFVTMVPTKECGEKALETYGGQG
jgi:hypothetical protein